MPILRRAIATEFRERMAQLREDEIGLDGVICAKGGEVRVHLPYIAACNPTLFKRISALLKSNKHGLDLMKIDIQGVEKLVEYLYTGEVDITKNNFEDILEVALATEMMDIIEFCVNLAKDSNHKLWEHILRGAFRHPRVCQPNDFFPNLIIENIQEIPRSILTTSLSPAYLGLILEHGKLADENRHKTLSIFVELIIKDKNPITTHNGALYQIKVACADKDIHVLHIPEDTEEDRVIELLQTANEINFDTLTFACVEYLRTRTPITTTLRELVKMAPNWTVPNYKLLDCLYQYLRETFDNFPLDIDEETLCFLLSSDRLEVQETKIFEVAVAWLNHNKVELAIKQKILSLIRFGLMRKEEFEKIVETQDELFSDTGNLLMSVWRYYLLANRQPFKTELNKMRLSHPRALIFGGKGAGGQTHSGVMSYTIGRESINEQVDNTEMPTSTHQLGAVAFNNFIFVCGGCGENETAIGNLYRLDPRNKTWLELVPMNSKRRYHSMAIAGESIIVSGGWNENNQMLDSVETFDISNNTWQMRPPLPYSLAEHVSVVMDDSVYLSGGSGRKSLLSLETKGFQCTELAPMLYRRQAHCVVSYEGKLVVFGGAIQDDDKGWIPVKQAECYDPVQDQWTELSPPPLPFIGSFHAIQGKNLFIFGGCIEPGGATDKIQKFDLAEDAWEECDTKLPLAISHGASATLYP